MLKAVLVGAGGMGGVHLNEYKNIKNVKLVAACDVRLDMLKEKTNGMDINLYSDFDDMLKNENPDIVDICTPTYMHKSMSIAALESGANVLCEKPMALSVNDCKDVINAAEKSGKIFMAAHVVRFMNGYIYLRNIIKSGKYGKLLRLDMKRASGVPRWSWENWMLDREKSGHVVVDMMIHDIDFIQDVFGIPQDIKGVYYDMKNMTNYASFDYIYDGFTVSAETGWYNPDVPFAAGYFALFENGFVEYKDNILTDCGEKVDFDNTQKKTGETGINISNVDGYGAEIAYFADCVEKGEKPDRVTIESSATSVELALKTIEKMTKI